jgi:DNA-directed RNA polymerase I and III subunit RPAC2
MSSAKKQSAKQVIEEEPHNNDVDMDSDQEQFQPDKFDFNTSRPELEVQRQDADNTSATYSFLNEDHTLGNLLRNVIIKNNNVEFCAYSVPHPSEPVMNVRLQVSKQAGDTKKVLRHGLKRISKMSDVLTEKF